MLRKLTILGTGTIISGPGRKCAGYLLETDDYFILMDCGPGTLIQLSETGADFSRIKYIFLTHFHLDHVSDLFAVIHSRWLRGVPDGDFLHIIGPVGLEDMMRKFRECIFKNEKWLTSEKIIIRETGECSFNMGSLHVKTLFTKHTDQSLCFRIEDDGGKSFFYSGDTGYNENIIVLGNDTTMAVLECSYSDSSQNAGGHMTVSKVMEYSRKVKTGKLLLSHFYPEILGSKDFSMIPRGENIIIANDLDTFSF